MSPYSYANRYNNPKFEGPPKYRAPFEYLRNILSDLSTMTCDY